MVNLKIEDSIYSKPLVNKTSYNTLNQEDIALVKAYAPKILEEYKSNFSDIMLEEFICDTYSEIKQWNLEGRLNGEVALSGPLRHAFLSVLLPKFAQEFPNRKLLFILGEEPYSIGDFGPILKHPEKEFSILPYIMDTNPHKEGYSGYLKRN